MLTCSTRITIAKLDDGYNVVRIDEDREGKTLGIHTIGISKGEDDLQHIIDVTTEWYMRANDTIILPTPDHDN